jgi:hypothetical protein
MFSEINGRGAKCIHTITPPFPLNGLPFDKVALAFMLLVPPIERISHYITYVIFWLVVPSEHWCPGYGMFFISPLWLLISHSSEFAPHKHNKQTCCGINIGRGEEELLR